MRIDGLLNGQSTGKVNVLDILSRLNIGDVIKAKVLEANSGELLLKLFDGSVFKASAPADMDAGPGEMLELAVRGMKDGNLVLETVRKDINSPNSQNEIKKLLVSMDIPLSPENIELAGEFRAADVKIGPEVFRQAAGLLKSFSELSPDKAVFLASKNIQPEAGKIETLTKLLEGRLKLGKQLDELQAAILALDAEASGETEATASKTATQAAKPGLTPDESNPAVRPGVLSGAASAEDSGPAVSIEVSQRQDGSRLNKSLGDIKPRLIFDDSDNATNKSSIRSEEGAGKSQAAASAQLQGKPAATRTTSAAQENDQIILKTNPDISNRKMNGQDKTASPASKTQTQPQPRLQSQPDALSEDAFAARSRDSATPAKHKEMSEKTGPESSLKILKHDAEGSASDPVQRQDKSGTEALDKLKHSLKSMFVKTEPDELKTGLDIKKLYSELAGKLDDIRNTAANSGLPGADSIAARANDLSNDVRLLSQLNGSTAYYQIPFNISGYNTTGELYVMKRNPLRKRIDPGDASMFISLDTQNIGRVESLIDIKGKNVSMNLRAADNKIIDFMKENCKYLYNGLMDKGFRLVDIRYRLIEEETNPVNMERSVKAALEDGRSSVDMRI